MRIGVDVHIHTKKNHPIQNKETLEVGIAWLTLCLYSQRIPLYRFSFSVASVKLQTCIEYKSITTSILYSWCDQRDSNSHAYMRQILSLLCLPFHHGRKNKGRFLRGLRRHARKTCMLGSRLTTFVLVPNWPALQDSNLRPTV